MRFFQALKEHAPGKKEPKYAIGREHGDVGQIGHRNSGISPTGIDPSGNHGDDMLHARIGAKKKKSKKKSPKMDEATTSSDVAGTDNPHLIDWYGKRKKKDAIVRRQFPKGNRM